MDSERERALELLRRHGWNTTSFQVLEEGMRYWFDDANDACVAYADTGSAWVAAGAPIARTEVLGEVIARFTQAARQGGRRVCFFAIEDRLAERGILESMPIGSQPSWLPSRWPEKLQASRSLREQLRRARAKGVVVRRVEPLELVQPGSAVRVAMESLIRTWLSSRKLAPMGFLVAVEPFEFPQERRYFVAERAGRVVGFLVAVPIFTRRGWFFEDLLRQGDAPNGTVDVLFDAAMREVGGEGAELVTLGLAPLAGDVSSWLLVARTWLRAFYDFDGLRRFKARLAPDAWERVHLAWPKGRSGAVALYDALSAFTVRRDIARASFLRFGLETAIGSPAFAVVLLATLLVPWTALLMVVSPTWFPAPWVRTAWVAFDCGLAVLLFALARKWRTWLARALVLVIALDAVLTVAQVATFNAHRQSGPFAWLALIVACTMPLLAALFLGLALRRAHLS